MSCFYTTVIEMAFLMGTFSAFGFSSSLHPAPFFNHTTLETIHHSRESDVKVRPETDMAACRF